MTDEPLEIRVARSAESAWLNARVLLAGGVRPAEIDLGAYSTEHDYTEDLVRVFEIPYPMGGVPGAIDWLSDLDWLSHATGHVVVLDRWDDAAADVADAAALITVRALNRWRNANPGTTYVVSIVADRCRAELIGTLTRYNIELDELGAEVPSTGARAVPIVIAD